MNYYIKYLFSLAILAFFACNLSKEVDIELPDYERQPVVECYLEPGKPFRLLLTRSYAFFDPFGLDSSFFQNTLLQGATVTISYNGQTDTLYNTFSFDPSPLKIFNYTGQNIVPSTVGVEYTLNVTLPDNGGSITGVTPMLPLVPIDSNVIEFFQPGDTIARVLTYVTDDPNEENYYRRLLNYYSLDSIPEQDFLASDRFLTTPKLAFGTGYELGEGDTIYTTVCHITKAYYDYVESVQLAIFGNLNPFAQPSPIKSNVTGSANPLGIFTCLVYDRDTTVIVR
ncbi:MAG: DUF4249 domain-containing protein [Haliscomenobacteraceae bacterium CHB4]|nr:hypothetical protein [Saprospiraceae bacterium]MCE7923414.1 DUF4249 domain-containing protein [Haliscomenobacteraceae bacterium CHB4]